MKFFNQYRLLHDFWTRLITNRDNEPKQSKVKLSDWELLRERTVTIIILHIIQFSLPDKDQMTWVRCKVIIRVNLGQRRSTIDLSFYRIILCNVYGYTSYVNASLSCIRSHLHADQWGDEKIPRVLLRTNGNTGNYPVIWRNTLVG